MVVKLKRQPTTSTGPGVRGSSAPGVASGMGNDRVPRVVIPRNPCRTKPRAIRIGTWNVRTMMKSGKLENIKREMRRNRLDILGLSEVRWKEGGDFESEEFTVCYAGGKESQRGVAIVLDK